MTTNAAPRTDAATSTAERRGVAETLDDTLDQWRGRIDELKIQVDLATLDVREDVAKQLEVMENVYLAVRSRLSDARHDSGESVSTLRQSVDRLLTDLRRTYDDADAVVTRSRQA